MTELREKIKIEFSNECTITDKVGKTVIKGSPMDIINWIENFISTLQLYRGKELPSDEEVSAWFEQNINNECSASSAIYKFRLWIKDLSLLPNREIKIPKEEIMPTSMFEKMLSWVTDEVSKDLFIMEYNSLYDKKDNKVPSEETPKGITENELLKVGSVLEENKRLKEELNYEKELANDFASKCEEYKNVINNARKISLSKDTEITSLTKQLEEATEILKKFQKAGIGNSTDYFMQAKAINEMNKFLSTLNTNSNG